MKPARAIAITISLDEKMGTKSSCNIRLPNNNVETNEHNQYPHSKNQCFAANPNAHRLRKAERFFGGPPQSLSTRPGKTIVYWRTGSYHCQILHAHHPVRAAAEECKRSNAKQEPHPQSECERTKDGPQSSRRKQTSVCKVQMVLREEVEKGGVAYCVRTVERFLWIVMSWTGEPQMSASVAARFR